MNIATISFGQAMPQEEMRGAAVQATACDLFLSLSSSLTAYPPSHPIQPRLSSPGQAEGAYLVIINREQTGLDYLADLVINENSLKHLDRGAGGSSHIRGFALLLGAGEP